jgi:hypothetical protein
MKEYYTVVKASSSNAMFHKASSKVHEEVRRHAPLEIDNLLHLLPDDLLGSQLLV